jgi:hypothetical protein
MSSIVIIEPYKMLQQALVLALPVGHRVRVMETLPQAAALAGVNAVIVDAAALSEKGTPAARGLNAIEAWQIPTLWIEADGTPGPPARQGLVILRKPVRRDELQKAVAECLGLTGVDKPGAATAPAKFTQTRKASRPQGAAKASAEPAIIELVDVVEETAAEEYLPPEN